jgi:hypothetical protein
MYFMIGLFKMAVCWLGVSHDPIPPPTAPAAPEQSIARGKEAASGEVPETKISDWTPLFEYCDTRFRSTPLEQLLTTAYMFRLPILKQMPAVLLPNAKLIPFPIEISSENKRKKHSGSDEDRIDRDVIAWEFFRQLTSRRLDPIGEERPLIGFGSWL